MNLVEGLEKARKLVAENYGEISWWEALKEVSGPSISGDVFLREMDSVVESVKDLGSLELLDRAIKAAEEQK